MNRRRRTDFRWAVASAASRLATGSAIGASEPFAVLVDRGIRLEALARRTRPELVHYHEGGSGPGVVLLNGWTASGLVWPTRLVARLERRCHVVRIDNRGTGWSRHAARPYTIADLADDARRVIDATGLARPTVVGLSMGGMIAQELALRSPEHVGRLLLLGTQPPSPEYSPPPPNVSAQLLGTPADGQDLRAFLDERWSAVAGPGFGARHPELVEDMVRAVAARTTPRFAVLDQARAIAAWHGASRLRRLAVETTVVHGSDDPLSPVRNGMRLAQLIPGARYIELEGVGHLVPYEALDRVAELIESGVG